MNGSDEFKPQEKPPPSTLCKQDAAGNIRETQPSQAAPPANLAREKFAEIPEHSPARAKLLSWFSFTGMADLDGLGNAADTLTFDLRHEAFVGCSFDGTDVNLGTLFDQTAGGPLTVPADQHFGPNNDADEQNALDSNQSFRISIENIVYTSGDGGNEMATFDGFQEFSIFGMPTATEEHLLELNAADVLTPGMNVTTLPTPIDALTLTATTAENRVRDLDFDFSVDTVAVPELSAFALLLPSGLLTLGSRRRRK